LSFDSRWIYDGKNSSEFERTVAVIYGSSLWIMLEEEEGLFGDLNDRSSEAAERRMRSGGEEW
jgi:hypothetical protein